MSIDLETKYFYLFQLVRFLCYCVVFFDTLSDVNPSHKSSVSRFDLYSESVLAEEEYLNEREQRGRLMCHPRYCVSAYISVVILTLSLRFSI